MNRYVILTAFSAVLAFSGLSFGQRNPAYSFTVDRRPGLGQIRSVVIQYAGVENRGLRLFEVIVPAATEAECLASRDFSAAVPADRETATLVYDDLTRTYKLRWTDLDRGQREQCRILIVRSQLNSSDLAVWQSNYGASGGRADNDNAKGAASTSDAGPTGTPQGRVVFSLGFRPVLGDPDQDGDVDGRDFLVWQRHGSTL